MTQEDYFPVVIIMLSLIASYVRYYDVQIYIRSKNLLRLVIDLLTDLVKS